MIFKKTDRFSRRDMLKGMGALGAASLLNGCSKSDTAEFYYSDSAQENESYIPEKQYSASCRSNCNIQCRLTVYTRNGRIVRTAKGSFVPEGGIEYDVDGNPTPIPDEQIEEAYRSYERVCLRGLSHVQRYYSSTRVLYPMQQTGNRGDLSTFKRISWDDALKIITDKIVELYDETDENVLGKKIYTSTLTGSYGILQGSSGAAGFLGSLLNTTTGGNSVDISLSIGLSRVMGSGAMVFVSGNELRDLKNAKNVFLWGSNMAESQQMGWGFLCNGRKENGGKIENVVSIETMLSSTAAKSDYFYCVRPGSDTMLALAMINVAVNEIKIHEDPVRKQWLLDNTDAMCLVIPDTRPGTYRYLRRKDFTNDPSHTEFVAYDGSNFIYSSTPASVTKITFATDGEITGEYPVSGSITARPAYQCIIDAVKDYSPEVAAAYTNISADDTRTLVKMYADGPSTIYFGFGASHHYNSPNFGHAIAVLAAITGNTGKLGASLGHFVGRWDKGLKGSFKNTPARTRPFSSIFNDDFAAKVKDGSNFIKMIMVNCGNPVSNALNVKNEYIDGIYNKNTPSPVELIVTHDMEMTDTARYSDLVLPAAHWFEMEELHQGSKHPFVVYQEKVAEPMGEALSDMDYTRLIVAALRERIPTLAGKIKDFYYNYDDTMKTDWEFIADRIDNKAPTEVSRVSSVNLKIQKAVRAQSPDKIYVQMEDPSAPGTGSVLASTTSGRLELFCEDPLLPVKGMFRYTTDYASFDITTEQLPAWVRPGESWSGPGADADLLARQPFSLMNEHTRWRVHTQWTDVPWLRELDPEPVLKINPDDAAVYGINTGDMVRVYNDRGHAVMRAILTPAVQKGMLNAPKGWQRFKYTQKYGDGGSYNDVSNSKIHPIACDMLIFDTRVAIERLV